MTKRPSLYKVHKEKLKSIYHIPENERAKTYTKKPAKIIEQNKFKEILLKQSKLKDLFEDASI